MSEQVPPPYIPEEVAAREPEDRFRTWVAIGIAVVSILIIALAAPPLRRYQSASKCNHR